MLTVAVLLALAARWCLAAPGASEYFVRGARKIDGDPTAMMLDFNDYTRHGIGADDPQPSGTYLGSTSHKPAWDWSIFGSATGQPALAEKVSLNKKKRQISTADLPSFLPSIPSLPSFSLPSFLSPFSSSVASVPTPTFTSSFFPSLSLQSPLSYFSSSGLFPGSSSFPVFQLPGGIRRSGVATVNGVPAPQTQLLVFRYPDVATFVRNGFSAISNGFTSLTSYFSGLGGGGLGNIINGNGIVLSSRTEPQPEDASTDPDWDI